MTDRELLEAAAKAAGIDVMRSRLADPLQGDMLVRNSARNAHHENGPWNPLTDDGDALRLAVKLEMRVDIFARTSSATITTNTDRHWVEEPHSLELMADAATRRAIVRAAAEMGK